MSERQRDLPERLASAYRIWGRIKVGGALVSGIAIFALMCFIVADVVSRNFLGGSISGSYEVAQNYLMPVAVFPALAYVYGTGVLPRMDLVRERLPRLAQGLLVHGLLGLELVIFGMVTYYTWLHAVDGQERGVAFPAGGDLYTLWPLFYLVPLGVAMILVETLFVLAANITGGTVSLAWEETDEVEDAA